jgi:hypothetical protein
MGGYDNEEHPPQGIPPRNQCHDPVIIRLVGGEYGEHWRAGTALRWTATHVMVAFEIPAGSRGGLGSKTSMLAWLRKNDVGRIVTADEMRAWLIGQRVGQHRKLAE